MPKPHNTESDCAPAANAARTSGVVSPIIRQFSIGTPKVCAAKSSGSGKGLVRAQVWDVTTTLKKASRVCSCRNLSVVKLLRAETTAIGKRVQDCQHIRDAGDDGQHARVLAGGAPLQETGNQVVH